MDDGQKPVASAVRQGSALDADVMDIDTANKAVAQLISKAAEVFQDGDQPIYVLSEEAAREVLESLQVKAPEVFVQTSAWSKPAPSSDNESDELLEAMGTELQSGVLAAELELVDQVQCEYGDEVHVLPDEKSAQEFIANLAASDAAAFQQNKQWNKQAPAGIQDNKHESLLTDIASRLRSIEAVLLRLETLFQMNVNR